MSPLIAGNYYNYSVIEVNEIKGALRFFLWTALREIEKCWAFINVRTQQWCTMDACRFVFQTAAFSIDAVESGHNTIYQVNERLTPFEREMILHKEERRKIWKKFRHGEENSNKTFSRNFTGFWWI
jgi:hypothetical protein